MSQAAENAVIQPLDHDVPILTEGKLDLQGLHCATCVRSVEQGVGRLLGIRKVEVNLATSRMNYRYDSGQLMPHQVIETVRGLGFEASLPEPLQRLRLKIGGLSCAGCVNSVKMAVNGLVGVESAEVNLALKCGTVVYDSMEIAPCAIEGAIRGVGFSSQRMKEDSTAPESLSLEDEEFQETKGQLVLALVFSLPLLVVAMGPMLGLPLPDWIAPQSSPTVHGWIQLLLTLPVIWAGRAFYLRGLPSLWRCHPDMDSLVALGTLAALGYSIWNLFLDAGVSGLYFDTAALILALILFGRTLESRSRIRASEAIGALLRLRPREAMLLGEDGEKPILVDLLQPGDRVRVRPGETLPADGFVDEGKCEVDESMLSGECLPRACRPGDEVTGGTCCVNGMIIVRVRRVGEQSALARIIRMVEDAQTGKAPVARMADRVAGVFVPFVLAVALLTALAWWMSGAGAEMIFTRMVAVLVIACPCALGLATPIAILVGTGAGARRGILFRNTDALESLQRIDTLLFDKTGTLTRGEPILEEIRTWNRLSESEALRLAASVETASEHPFGRAVVEEAKQKGLDVPKPGSFEALTGSGVSGLVEKRRVVLGQAELIRAEANMDSLPENWDLEEEGGTVVWMLVDGTLAARFSFSDVLRPESEEAIKRLQSLGLKTVMLTGDRPAVAERIASEAGVAEVKAELLPEDKVRVLREYQSRGCRVGMVGDGVNDAPALAAADVGIGMGSGTDITLETADVVLMRSDLGHLADALRLCRATLTNIRQNLFWAFAYNVFGIPVAAGVLVPFGGPALHPVLAAAAMALSSLSVVTNCLRLRHFKFR